MSASGPVAQQSCISDQRMYTQSEANDAIRLVLEEAWESMCGTPKCELAEVRCLFETLHAVTTALQTEDEVGGDLRKTQSKFSGILQSQGSLVMAVQEAVHAIPMPNNVPPNAITFAEDMSPQARCVMAAFVTLDFAQHPDVRDAAEEHVSNVGFASGQPAELERILDVACEWVQELWASRDQAVRELQNETDAPRVQ